MHRIELGYSNADNRDLESVLGRRQELVLLNIASSIGDVAASLTTYHSDGLKAAARSFHEVEYCEPSALPDVQ